MTTAICAAIFTFVRAYGVEVLFFPILAIVVLVSVAYVMCYAFAPIAVLTVICTSRNRKVGDVVWMGPMAASALLSVALLIAWANDELPGFFIIAVATLIWWACQGILIYGVYAILERSRASPKALSYFRPRRLAIPSQDDGFDASGHGDGVQ